MIDDDLAGDRVILTREDADSILDDITDIYEGWYSEAKRIDWEDFVDRLENRGYDMGTSMMSPAIRRIKELV